MGEVLRNIWAWCLDNITVVVTVILAVIDIAPIKFNPIKAILKWLGKHFNAELKTEIDTIKADAKATKEKVEELERTVDNNEMDRIRWEILGFANSCRCGTKHSKEEFDHIISLEAKYTDLLTKTDTTNGVFEEEYKYILELYHHCLKNNTFI